MYRASSRYLLVSEYYSPNPLEVVYRGHSGKLFKRDFAGDLMDMYPDLSLLDYGFIWRRGRSLSPACLAFMQIVREIEQKRGD
jgi:hypothetical protein